MRLTRRAFGLGILSLGVSASAQAQSPRDQGIGGTGAAPKPNASSDRGIGGTGVIGTIRRFGSIYVNDLRIAYPATAEVFIDGVRSRISDMKVGHVVRTIAMGPQGALATQRIEAFSEVVGPVEKVGANSIVVLGQSIDLRAAPRGNQIRPGAFVAVFGLRRPNGVVVASLVEPRGAGRGKIAGPVTRDASGRPAIGGLVLRGLPAGLSGSRVSVEGRRQGDAFVVESFHSLARPFGPEVERVSIEGFVGSDGKLSGSGLYGAGASDGRARGGGSALAVVSGRLGASGGLIVQEVRRRSQFQIPEAGGPAAIVPTAPLGGPSGAPGLLDVAPRGGAPNLPGPGGLLPGGPAPGLGGGGLPNLGLPGGIGGGGGGPLGLPLGGGRR